MSIHISKVNISLDQFNAVASGKYNIGEVRLTKDGTGVEKVNNHKNTTFFSNNVKMSAEEAFSVKEAFVRALSGSGVDSKAIARIKKDLGIENKAVALSKRDIRPLTRQEVRSIIDNNAAAINAKRGAGGVAAIRTSAQIYAGVSDAEKEARQEIRNNRNAVLKFSRAVTFDSQVDNLLSIINADYAGKGARASEIQEMSILLSEALERLGEGKARYADDFHSLRIGEKMVKNNDGEMEPGTIYVSVTMDDGRMFKLDTGLKRAEFKKRLDDVPGKDAAEFADDAVSKTKAKNFAMDLLSKRKINGNPTPAEYGALVDAALDECGDDSFLVKIVQDAGANIVVDGGAHLRSEEKTRAKIAAIRANLEELRELDKTHPGVYEFGKGALEQLNGKSLGRGVFAKIIAAAETLPIEKFAASANPTLADIHASLKALMEAQKALAASIDAKDVEGADERTAVRDLMFNYALRRLTQDGLKNILKMVKTKPFLNLQRLYRQGMTNRVYGPDGKTAFCPDRKAKLLSTDYLNLVDNIHGMACGMLGIDFKECQIPEPDNVNGPATTGIPEEILAEIRPAPKKVES